MESADATTLDILALSVAECLGSEAVSQELATSLQALLPGATFLRAAVRCGTGLFVTDNLLQPGYSMLSLVSLKHSLAGIAMKQSQAVQLRIPAAAASYRPGPSGTRVVACAPVCVSAPEGTTFRALPVGALIFGSAGTISAELAAGAFKLAGASGAALLTVGLGRVKHLSHLLSLRDHDAEYVGAEEDMQDLPIEICRPPGGYGGSNGTAEPPTQPLTLERTQASRGSMDSLSRMDLRTSAATDIGLGGCGRPLAAPELNDEPAALPLFSKGTTDWHAPIKPSSFGSGDNNNNNNNDHDEPEGCRASQLSQLSQLSSDLPLTPLLTFPDPVRESAYIIAKAQANVVTDAAFSAMHLLAMLCLLCVSAPLAQPHAWAALLLSAILPLGTALAALSGNAWWYPRCREAMLVLLVAVHVAVAQRGGALDSGKIPAEDASVGILPCLLRFPDAVLAMVLPLGCRVRFCWLLPLQLVNLGTVAKHLPWKVLHTCGCAFGCAALLGVFGAAVPLGVAHSLEARERKLLQSGAALPAGLAACAAC